MKTNLPVLLNIIVCIALSLPTFNSSALAAETEEAENAAAKQAAQAKAAAKKADEAKAKQPKKSKTVKTGDKIYTWINASGERVYSQTPRKGAKEMRIKESTRYTEPNPVSGFDNAKIKVVEDNPNVYDNFAIASPGNEATVRNNDGNLQVAISISPALKTGHQIVLKVDGAEVATGYSPIINLTNINRGEHQITAEVFDDQGNLVIAAKPVTVFMHQAFIRNN
jgi:type II secretory pathway pseudopilin PulG